MELSTRKVIIAQCKNIKKKGKSAMRKGCVQVSVRSVQFHKLYLLCEVMRTKVNRT